MNEPVIAIVGSGAVGCYYGGRLVEHGRDVHFLMRRDYEAVRRGGLTVRSWKGDFRLPAERVKAYDHPLKMPRADLVIVTLKSTANAALPELVGPLVRDGTTVLTLQNGLGNEESLAELFGAERVVGGIAFTCINRVSPGVIEHTAQGWIKIGEFVRGRGMERVNALSKLFNESGIECEAVQDLVKARWEKLLWNVPFNGLSAAMDMTTDKLLATRDGEEVVRRIMGDVIAAARAAGVTLETSMSDKMIERTRGMGAYWTSSHIDRREGREMEVEALFGRPVQVAREAGVRVTWMEGLLATLKRIQHAEFKIQSGTVSF